MKFSLAFLAISAAAALGIGLFVIRDEAAYESAPSITLEDPLPEGSVAATVTGVNDPPLRVSPGIVIELTYAGSAAAGHAPCNSLEVLTDGEWRATHSLSSAFGGPEDLFGGGTGDARVIDDHGRLFLADRDESFQLVCPAMVMVGTGPERFRLPLIAPQGPARLCLDFSAPCFALDYSR